LRYIGALAVAVPLLLATVGCSDDEEPTPRAVDELEQIEQATLAEGSARYAGQTGFADGTTAPIDGASQADPPAGEVRYSVRTDQGPQQVTVLWRDGNVYVERAVTADPGAVSATLRLDTDPPWTQAIYQPLATVTFDAYDPFRLLERLSLLGVEAVAQGSETIDGKELDRYVVDLADRPVTPGGARAIELLTDDEQRLQTVRLNGDDRIEYAIEEYGVAVAPSVPPADQIGVSDRPPAVVPTGPFEPVAQGTSPDAGAWQLMRAPGTDGGTCWRLDTAAPLDPVAATNPDGVTCLAAVDPDAAADEQVQVVVDAGSIAPFDAVVAVVPAGSTRAEVQFADRRSEELTIDPGGFVVRIGPKEPLAVVLEVTTPGGVVSCGPGTVTEVGDLETMPPDERAVLDRSPWLCLAL
jgi:hypothetical protein